MAEKTKVEDVNRSIYDIKNEDDYEFKMQKGLNEQIVREISSKKNEPEWMLEIRLKSLKHMKNYNYHLGDLIYQN